MQDTSGETVDAGGPVESLSATLATTFLGCRASAAWQIEARRGVRPAPVVVEDPHGELVARKGFEDEAACLEGLRERCGDVVRIPNGAWPARVAATVAAMTRGTPLIYQAALADAPWIGFADFLVRVASPCRHCHVVGWGIEGANTSFVSRCRNRSPPLRHRFGSEGPQGRSGDEMALQVEGVVDGGMQAEKSLRGAGRFEPLHLALSSSHSLMRVLGPVVHAPPLLVPAGQAKSPESGGIGGQLIGDRHLWCKAVLLQQLAHQPLGCPLVPARLDQDIEDLALLIDSPPQIHAPAGDPHDHLIQMPAIARTWPLLPQTSREERPELQHPAPDRFVGQVEPAFGKELLDIAVAQGEAQIEPDCVLDDRGREAMAAVGEGGHAVRIAQSGQPYRRRDNAFQCPCHPPRR